MTHAIEDGGGYLTKRHIVRKSKVLCPQLTMTHAIEDGGGYLKTEADCCPAFIGHFAISLFLIRWMSSHGGVHDGGAQGRQR
jgi:hypothetical protein